MGRRTEEAKKRQVESLVQYIKFCCDEEGVGVFYFDPGSENCLGYLGDEQMQEIQQRFKYALELRKSLAYESPEITIEVNETILNNFIEVNEAILNIFIEVYGALLTEVSHYDPEREVIFFHPQETSCIESWVDIESWIDTVPFRKLPTKIDWLKRRKWKSTNESILGLSTRMDSRRQKKELTAIISKYEIKTGGIDALLSDEQLVDELLIEVAKKFSIDEINSLKYSQAFREAYS